MKSAVGFGWTFLGLVLGLGLARRCSPRADGGPTAPQVSASDEPAAVATLERERQAAAAREHELERQLADLRAQLVEANAARIQREEEFLQYTQMITQLVPKEAPPEILLALTGEVPESSLPAVDPQLEARRAADRKRADEIAISLRSLMFVDGFDSLSLLEAGTLGEGWVGPVVFRIIDEHGRPAGSLCADRLRLEGSRAGWTVTFVFEAGYERRAGERVPFEGTLPGEERGGVRRIVLVNTDPDPWVEAVPELFGTRTPEPIHDDGQWQRMQVHRRLNELLSLDAAGGSYRLSHLGGVVEDVLRDVEVEQLTREGHLVQRLVADRLSIVQQERGMLLELRDGVILKGSKKRAFLEGRYRIFLPRARHEEWRAAGLPGLVAAGESSAGRAALAPVR